MWVAPLLLPHIGAGVVSVFAGYAAISFRKGGQRHARAGSVFVVAMVVLGATGSSLGFMKHQVLNGAMGILTCYLVATAWLTARRGDAKTSALDWATFTVPVAIAVGLIAYGSLAPRSPMGTLEGYPAGGYFVFGGIAALFATGDVRMLARGGTTGSRRIARHLTRMCFAFFIAAGSFFLGRQHIFPEMVRNSGALYLLTFLPLILLLFWLVRVRFTSRGRTAFGESSPG